MACCAVGAAITAGIVWAVRWVRTRVLARPPEPDAAAWRLEPSLRA